MKVELENLSKRWGSAVGADSMNLDIEDGEFVAFLGRKRCDDMIAIAACLSHDAAEDRQPPSSRRNIRTGCGQIY